MIYTRKWLAALFAAGALAAAGCGTDDAVERDIRDGAQEVREGAEEVGKDLEKAVPGDSDDDGK